MSGTNANMRSAFPARRKVRTPAPPHTAAAEKLAAAEKHMAPPLLQPQPVAGAVIGYDCERYEPRKHADVDRIKSRPAQIKRTGHEQSGCGGENEPRCPDQQRFEKTLFWEHEGECCERREAERTHIGEDENIVHREHEAKILGSFLERGVVLRWVDETLETFLRRNAAGEKDCRCGRSQEHQP